MCSLKGKWKRYAHQIDNVQAGRRKKRPFFPHEEHQSILTMDLLTYSRLLLVFEATELKLSMMRVTLQWMYSRVGKDLASTWKQMNTRTGQHHRCTWKVYDTATEQEQRELTQVQQAQFLGLFWKKMNGERVSFDDSFMNYWQVWIRWLAFASQWAKTHKKRRRNKTKNVSPDESWRGRVSTGFVCSHICCCFYCCSTRTQHTRSSKQLSFNSLGSRKKAVQGRVRRSSVSKCVAANDCPARPPGAGCASLLHFQIASFSLSLSLSSFISSMWTFIFSGKKLLEESEDWIFSCHFPFRCLFGCLLHTTALCLAMHCLDSHTELLYKQSASVCSVFPTSRSIECVHSYVVQVNLGPVCPITPKTV